MISANKLNVVSMKKIVLAFAFISILLYSCNSGKTQAHDPENARDISINPATSHNEVFFDSSRMEQFIKNNIISDSLASRLRSFYNGRNYQFAWFFEEGMADYAVTFYQACNDYIFYSGDSSLFNAQLKNLYDSIQGGDFNFSISDSLVVTAELRLTIQFFRYSRRVYQGSNQLNTRELEWFIPRKKVDPVSLLDTMLANVGKDLSKYEPINQQYRLLKDYLVKYYEIEKQGGWPQIRADKKSYKLNDTSQAIRTIKQRLQLTGDLSAADTGNIFTPDLELAIRNFEKRYGFKANGVITPALISEMNRPIRERLQQILINMERLRWMPATPESDFLFVNIPEYRLYVYEKGKPAFDMNVVVGTTANNTVIFTGTLKHIVFSPYWNVPPGILKNEVMPGIRRNKNYLASHNMEWNGGAVRQKPGPRNSLGLVKFLFPNSYSIYLHDTPSKSKFEAEKRTFSHGCIRLSEPKKLAEFLLRNDASWDSEKIGNAMNAGKEKYVEVKDKIPVYIGYFTAWVDQQGKLNFREDVYGHDKKMKARLFSK
jgi:L,D-transpeptidase YcbB